MTPARVVVLGDVMADVVCRPAGPVAPGTDTPARIDARPGGSAANTAAWLAHLGVAVTFRGAVGDDAAGRAAADALAQAGVDADLDVIADVATGTCVVLLDPAGERSFLTDPGANAHLRARALPEAAHVHVSGYALMREGSRAAARAALRDAAAAGTPASIDAASAAPLGAMGAAAFREAAGGAPALLATIDEAEVLTGRRDPGGAEAALLEAHAEVVLKLGGAGARWASIGAGRAAVPAAPAPGPVVDQTGAGDAFAAGWIAAGLRGESPAERLRAACALAARAVTLPGARPPRRG